MHSATLVSYRGLTAWTLRSAWTLPPSSWGPCAIRPALTRLSAAEVATVRTAAAAAASEGLLESAARHADVGALSGGRAAYRIWEQPRRLSQQHSCVWVCQIGRGATCWGVHKHLGYVFDLPGGIRGCTLL